MIPHIESTVKIYVTDNYGLFIRKNGNRILNANKIKKIKSDIESGLDMLCECPIVVSETLDGKLEIIDGQHRFNVARLLKKNVYYVIKKDLNLFEIAKINSAQEKWKQKDFLKCYCETGDTNYIILRDFIEKYKFPFTTCIQLLSVGYELKDGGTHLNELFESGKFKVQKEKDAIELSDIILKFNYLDFYSSRLFIIAIGKIIKSDKIKISDLIESISKNRNRIEKQLTWKLYTSHLETIYNIGKHTRVTIY